MKTCLVCGTPLLPGCVSIYCSAKCAGQSVTLEPVKPGGARPVKVRSKGRETKPTPVPLAVLSMWKVRVCLYCEKEFRTGNTDHKNPTNPYCSLRCLAATREGVDDDDSYWKEKAEARKKQRGPAMVGTCSKCASRLVDGECFHCR